MVFLSGPRQVGKTTLAKALPSEGAGRYFNWDVALDRKRPGCRPGGALPADHA